MKEKQELLMIPGPIEFSPAVLNAMSRPTNSHVSPEFVACFGRCLERLGDLFLAPKYQSFILAGSGTLAMDVALSNLLEPDDGVLIVHSGYFSDRMRDIAELYGARVDVVSAETGSVPGPEDVQKALEKKDYKIVCITHVDTSTSVLADIKGISAVARKADALVVVDGVAAAGGAECRTEEWGIDIYLTASQKAVGVPPGLALLTVSPRALKVAAERTNPVPNYYASFTYWLPIMEAYQARKPAYFGTPAVNLVYALEVSLKEILEDEGLEERFIRHEKQGQAFRAGLRALGMQPLPAGEELCAPTLTAVYYPEGVSAALNAALAEEGVLVAGGLLPAIKGDYFRIGHMGYSGLLDLMGVLGGLERALIKCGYDAFSPGAALQACQKEYLALRGDV